VPEFLILPPAVLPKAKRANPLGLQPFHREGFWDNDASDVRQL